jgi:hypothetical protein
LRSLVLLALVAACSAPNKKCKDNTLFVSVTLEGATQNADQIFVDVSLDHGAPVHTVLSHTAGRGMGGVEIDFPSGYPKGHEVEVTLTALVSGGEVGRGSSSRTLGNGCDALDVPVMPSVTSGDLAGIDFSGEDLAGVDLATVPDLQTPDLTTFVDLQNCMPVAEDCFNGTDDDCDGLIDCADPDCTGGATPVAQCVSDPGVWTVGVQSAANCPTSFPSPVPIGSTFTAAVCNTASCTCPTGNVVNGICSGTVTVFGSADSMCSMGATATFSAVDDQNSGCAAISIPSNAYHTISTLWQSATGCTSNGGVPDKTPATFSDLQNFCKPARIGSGCNAGSICVPFATKRCVMTAGSQVTCPTDYVLDSKRYYASVTDTVGCACKCGWSNGTCNSPSFYVSSGCTGSKGDGLAPGCDNGILLFYTSLHIGTEATTGACTSPYAYGDTGNSHPSDEQTICCVP